MATTFVILAAGRGTRLGRVGESIHKCLVPLEERAIITHQLENRPPDSDVVIVVGDRSDQVKQYIEFAHPDLDPVFIYDPPGRGPGSALLAGIRAVPDNDDIVFTTCDTLWGDFDWQTVVDLSWAGVAPIPPGTPSARWCRMVSDVDYQIIRVLDKVPDQVDPRHGTEYAWTGLGGVAAADRGVFYHGLLNGAMHGHELQISGGFRALVNQNELLSSVLIDWTDVGDEDSYRTAVRQRSGYDWTKTDQATYVLPETGTVIKFHAFADMARSRARRGEALFDAGVVRRAPRFADQFVALDYVPGTSFYRLLESFARSGQDLADGRLQALLSWVRTKLRQTVEVGPGTLHQAGHEFYHAKTYHRISMLSPALRGVATDAVDRINWREIIGGIQPGIWHGDLNFANIVVDESHDFWGIDWRENFAGRVHWGDLRYDVAKLLAGTVIHWDNARRGDFRPWETGPHYAEIIRNDDLYTPECETLGALTLLNSAPLHASPLDEVLVVRAISWLKEIR